MFRRGTHAAQHEAGLRGYRSLWSGVQGPSAISAVTRDRSWHAPYAALGVRLRGAGGADVRPGFKGYQQVPFDAILVGMTIVADRAGSIVFDIYRSTWAAFPPRQKDTLITLSTFRPALNVAQVASDDALFGWQTVLTKDEVLGFDVLSASGLNSVTLTLILSPNHRL
jgi:hypothetical protein